MHNEIEKNEESINIPILDIEKIYTFPILINEERQLLTDAAELFKLNFCDYALLGIWNAAVSNLKRRVEAYGVDLWISVVQEEGGRKKYDKDGETLSGRWEGVDDLVLISGVTKLGLLNKKAGKSLEMINWMRNHASAAHENENKVEREDVIGLALILQKNLFEVALPDPGHSVSALFDPVKSSILSRENFEMLKDEINALRLQDVRICFGFILDLVCRNEEPSTSNASELFATIWSRTNEDLRKTAGIKYHSFNFESTIEAAEVENKIIGKRLLSLLVQVDGIKYIPDAARAKLYRLAAKRLCEAKDAAYGWKEEEQKAIELAQFGPYVPSIIFEVVYQEILAVWCGNFWGRSTCYIILEPFIKNINIDQARQIISMFANNERVKSELSQTSPKKNAIALLSRLELFFTLEAHKEEARKVAIYIELL